ASLDQSGNQNAFGLFQFGEGTTGHVSQSGNGQSGLLFQFGF
ncbi:MAG TPA: curlin, partial [Alphaproteobacteria bacterium]|nr:curlin [Alphaproteobacteria bacterium]